jgi:hypothetical protein
MTKILKYISSFIFTIIIFTGCYSFKGISIPADVKTFYVQQVKLTDFKAPPDTPERFMEQIRQKVRSQSSLTWNENDPDVEFDCTVTGFNVTNEGNSQGNQVSLNKLTIVVNVDYINNRNEDDNWNKSFSFGLPFDPALELQDVQDDFIEDIFDQISENVFNDAFTNW